MITEVNWSGRTDEQEREMKMVANELMLSGTVSRCAIGIDPGRSGGIACLQWGEGSSLFRVACMPNDMDDLSQMARVLYTMMKGMGRTHCMIEKVGPRPNDGCRQAFKFGESVGAMRALVVAAGISFDEVPPRIWQREFGLVFPKKKGLTYVQKKNKNKARAAELFPQLRVTHAVADALLIAEFCRRRHSW